MTRTHAVFSVPINVAKISLQSPFAIFYAELDNDLQHTQQVWFIHAFEIHDKYETILASLVFSTVDVYK